MTLRCERYPLRQGGVLTEASRGRTEATMASLVDWDHRCIACGGRVADVLWSVGSMRCHECRDRGRIANPAILKEWAEAQRLTAQETARRLREAEQPGDAERRRR
jgi:hypothetical protein